MCIITCPCGQGKHSVRALFGPKNLKATMKMAPYTPFRNLNNGDFVFTWPLNSKVYPIWLSWANIDVFKDEGNEHYRMVHVQWWVSLKKGAMNDVEMYWNYWWGKWKCNLNDPMQWLNFNSIAFSLLSRKKMIVNNTITISDVHASWARANIEEVNALNHN